jgi:hypothetical protein
MRWPSDQTAKVELRDFNRKEREDPMTEERLVLAELLEKAGEGDFLRAVVEAVLQLLMDEAAIVRLIGAVLLEQNEEWQSPQRYMRVEAMAEMVAAANAADPRQILCAA